MLKARQYLAAAHRWPIAAIVGAYRTSIDFVASVLMNPLAHVVEWIVVVTPMPGLAEAER
ncbi:MAG: hypothetical protein WBD71_02270 [Xanthobacteraceae bacterium]